MPRFQDRVSSISSRLLHDGTVTLERGPEGPTRMPVIFKRPALSENRIRRGGRRILSSG
jgi:hypothetical protein